MIKTGRNDPCPCGSGKKYKQCCAGERSTPEVSSTGSQLQNGISPAALNELAASFQAAQYPLMESLALSLIERYPHAGLAWKALGAALQGQRKDALPALQKATQLLPLDAETFNNLGAALLDRRRPSEALVPIRRAIALSPHSAPAHCNLGKALRDLGYHQEAIASYRRAIEIKPDFAGAHCQLGIALNDIGDQLAAAQAYETAITYAPSLVEAHYGISQLKSYDPGDAHLTMLESQTAQADRMPLESRIRYWFTLGKAREDIGSYDAAFAAYSEGNRLRHATLTPDDGGADTLLARIAATFTKELFADRRGFGHEDPSPVFIVGMPRSGTSLLEQILATCTGIYGAGELPDMSAVAEETFRTANLPFPLAVPRLSAQELASAGHRYIERIRRHSPDADRIVDKMPANFFYIGFIHLILPNARIIHATRDPMDSCFSCYSRLFTGDSQEFAYDLESLGRYYVRYARLMEHWGAVLPADTMLEVSYEALVEDTEAQARRLLDYLGLPWDARCLDFHRNSRPVHTASSAQVRKPVYQSSVARWERFRAHLGPLLDLVEPYRQ